MHPDREILHTYRQLDSLSIAPDNLNNLTFQSAVTNDAPRDLCNVPVTPYLSGTDVEASSPRGVLTVATTSRRGAG